MKLHNAIDRNLQRSFLFSFALVWLLATPTHANLWHAEDIMKNQVVRACQGNVREFLKNAASRERYDAVEELGEACAEHLSNLLRHLEATGSTFRDSSNRSWASSMKRDVVGAATEAHRYAEAVERAGDRETSAKEELEQLDEALMELFNEYNKAQKAYQEHYKKLDRDARDAAEEWFEESRDDVEPYMEHAARMLSIFQRYDRQLAALFAAQRAVRDAAQTANLVRRTGDVEEIEEAYKRLVVAQRKFDSENRELSSLWKQLDDARTEQQELYERFVREARESAKFMTSDYEEARFRANEVWMEAGDSSSFRTMYKHEDYLKQ